LQVANQGLRRGQASGRHSGVLRKKY
jgi:hypothetical protein